MFFPGSKKEQLLRSHLPGIEQGSDPLPVLTNSSWDSGEAEAVPTATTPQLLSPPPSAGCPC